MSGSRARCREPSAFLLERGFGFKVKGLGLRGLAVFGV